MGTAAATLIQASAFGAAVDMGNISVVLLEVGAFRLTTEELLLQLTIRPAVLRNRNRLACV